MLYIPNKQNQFPEQAVLEAKQLRGIQVARFPTTASTNHKTRLNVKILLVPNKRILSMLTLP